MGFIRFLALILVLKAQHGLAIDLGDDISKTITITKCCDYDEILVETSLSNRLCKKRKNLLQYGLWLARYKWEPAFQDENGKEVHGPKSIELKYGNGTNGKPQCAFQKGEFAFPVFHSRKSNDDFKLLVNGTLTHRVKHGDGESSEWYQYTSPKYCLDDLLVTHNFTQHLDDDANNTDDVLTFAYICVDQSVDLQSMLDHYIYPISLAVSMMCFILTFLLYSFLPQLRDLTGKFILGICSFLCIAFAALLAQLLGSKDPNVEKMTTEVVLHSSIVGVWFCLNAMGHHIWKIIKSKSVFTRVTDGQRLRYYSFYIGLSTSIICTLALCVHFFIEEGQGVGKYNLGKKLILISHKKGITIYIKIDQVLYLPILGSNC